MYKRTWIITGEVTRDDLEWVLRSKLSFTQGEQNYFAFSDIGNGIKAPMRMAGHSEPPTIITTDEKEETWLKLYFADRAILLAEEVMYKYE
jgi:hypothetical protein